MTAPREACKGFTLTELLIALILLAFVGAGAQRALLGQLRLSRETADRITLQRNLRGSAAFVLAELRGLAPPAGDILAMAADSITYRVTRSTTAACQVIASEIWILTGTTWGYRQPAPGRDSLRLFVEGSPVSALDDRWISLPIQGLVQGSNCTGRPALGLATAIDTFMTPLSHIALDAPAYVYEVIQVRLYQSGGRSWLGARSVSAGEVIQPVFGPFATQGLTLSYVDSLGVATADPRRVRSVGLRILGITEHPMQGPGPPVSAPGRDSLIGLVTLRNGPVP